MRQIKFQISNFLLIFLAVWIFSAGFVSAQSGSQQFNVSVGVFLCNNDGICQPNFRENETNCFNDCGCNNNNTCDSERDEDGGNCPHDCATASDGINSPGFAALTIDNLKIGKITFDSAQLAWQTNKSALCAIYFGVTSEYEKEIISETGFSSDHLLDFNDLDPSTAYHFNIRCKDYSGIIAQTGDKSFATLYVIGNVNNFTARAGENKIFLNWENPAEINFDSVRIVKNENFYPADRNDGTILYEGTVESFVDKNVKAGKLYYYAAFAKGKNGSWSSGAMASAQIQSAQIPVTPITPITQETKKLKLSDFDFYSDGVEIPVIDEKTVEPKANRQLIISIDYGKVPLNYKKIFVELDDGPFDGLRAGNKFYYLFAPNNKKTVYSVNMVSPLLVKNYPFKLNFLDENNKIISELNGELAVWSSETKTPQNWLLVWLRNNITIVVLWIILILLLILLFILEKRKRKKSKK